MFFHGISAVSAALLLVAAISPAEVSPMPNQNFSDVNIQVSKLRRNALGYLVRLSGHYHFDGNFHPGRIVAA